MHSSLHIVTHVFVCVFSPGGSFTVVENVTEEVQSLRNRVELLEKVHERTHEHVLKLTNKSYLHCCLPRNLSDLCIHVQLKTQLLFNHPTKHALKYHTCTLAYHQS
ncbi:hypothetical protein XENORESO_019332 [Xenotaenia resolanae]|uniref:Uncharacterized protein n=1 Tax=Xenotaenia resolanae TaxID=208358 RepID=A0ABV0X428_9TELE